MENLSQYTEFEVGYTLGDNGEIEIEKIPYDKGILVEILSLDKKLSLIGVVVDAYSEKKLGVDKVKSLMNDGRLISRFQGINNHKSTMHDLVTYLKILPYDEDTWVYVTNNKSLRYMYVNATDAKELNSFVKPYKFQFNDLVLEVTEKAMINIYNIAKITCESPNGSPNRKAPIKKELQGLKFFLRSIEHGSTKIVGRDELEKYFELC